MNNNESRTIKMAACSVDGGIRKNLNHGNDELVSAWRSNCWNVGTHIHHLRLIDDILIAQEMSNTNDSVCARAAQCSMLMLPKCVAHSPYGLSKILFLLNQLLIRKLDGSLELPTMLYQFYVASSDTIGFHIYIIHHIAAILGANECSEYARAQPQN